MGRDPTELVFALCHEVGNLLAAARLQAYTLGGETSPEDLNHGRDRISAVAARAGSLLALIRPLLSAPNPRPPQLEPIDVLDGLRSGLDPASEPYLRLQLKTAASLPRVRASSELIHHLLLAAVFAALEAGDAEVSVSAAARAGRVVFRVGPGGKPPEGAGGPLRGFELAAASAELLLAPFGGGAVLRAEDSIAWLELELPAAG